MMIWAIADLHLGSGGRWRTDRFGSRWAEQARKIEEYWREVVGPEDLVLIPGDISMAVNHRELQPDLNWLSRLPGRKVLSPGNHDRWWNDTEVVRRMLRDDQFAVCGDAIRLNGVILCGTQGAPVPNDDANRDQQHAADHERDVLVQALDQAQVLREADEPILVLWHFPPFDLRGRPGPWVPLMVEAGVEACLYGHVHGTHQWSATASGRRDRILYRCVAADAIGFRPLKIEL